MRNPSFTPLDLMEPLRRIEALEKKVKSLNDENYDHRKRIERLEAQFDIQGARVTYPRLYYPEKKPSETISHVVDLKDFENKFNETMWKMIEIIATTGIARYPEIERVFREQDPDFIESRLRRAAKSLTEMNVITKTVLKLPLRPITILYSLAQIGDRLYNKKFKFAPVPSEMVKVIKEHDNLEHGYGILDLAQLLVDSGKFKEVCSFNRTQPIEFESGKRYIPDIMCKNWDSDSKTYFEYERGFHNHHNFNEKCEKMRSVTRYLNFVAPNQKELVNRLYPLVKDWIKKIGQFEYHNFLVRLTTPTELQKCHLSNHSWLVVFNPAKSIEPVVCKVKLD